jgi:hypothetical protein
MSLPLVPTTSTAHETTGGISAAFRHDVGQENPAVAEICRVRIDQSSYVWGPYVPRCI